MTAPMTTARRLAAPAPATHDDDDDAACDRKLAAHTQQHALCEAWSSWCRTRRFYGRPALPPSLLGRLTSATRATAAGAGPDAEASAHLSALHLAIISQPADALDRQVFELHYLWRVRNIKAAAAELGVARQHWYRLVAQFRERVCAAASEILSSNLGIAATLAHHPGDRDDERRAGTA